MQTTGAGRVLGIPPEYRHVFPRELRGLVGSGAAVLLGFGLAVIAVVYPAWMQTRGATVVASRALVGRVGPSLWQRLWLDVALLVAGGPVFWRTASSGYQLVLAPEGVAQACVHYVAFLAPVCLWLGVSLLGMRLSGMGLLRGRRALAWVLRPLARGLSMVVAASLGRQRSLIARGVVLVALACAFATATAVFNTTYNGQSRVDAQPTNGADVTVNGATANPAGSRLADLGRLPGVAGIQSMQHRYAYVGHDLQDLYDIDPLRIGQATHISNAFFQGGHAPAVLAALARQPDGCSSPRRR